MKRLEMLSYMPSVSDGMVDDKGWSKGARMRTSMARVEMETDEFLDGNDPVQVAIFELEGTADLKMRGLVDILDVKMSPLAQSALDHASSECRDWSYYGFSFHAAYPFIHLEAAALLRDGWRPEGIHEVDPPYVCPGCHAVAPERCLPGCIDAEIEEDHRRDIEQGDYGDRDDD